MNEFKNTNTKTDFKSTATVEQSQNLLNLNVYKELDENPNQNLDLVTHIQNQLQQLSLIHKRKMFLIKELATVYSRKD